MNIISTELQGVTIIEPQVFGDQRGFFKETWHKERYQSMGIEVDFVQDNFSRSTKGVLRGLHFQKTKPQGKLIQCLAGEIYDVVVDINPQSATYGQHVGLYLNDENHRQLYIPPGYAHGFCVVSEVVDISYKCTDFYCPEDEGGLIWSDPDLDIAWPVEQPRLSAKDQVYPTLRELNL